jgi:putative phosphoserine phosphatase/1-acylglycerol-3-phosphate O-acyltransferase
MAERVLEEAGQHTFERHLATQIYPESRALVKAHQEMGHTVAIITSATRYQAEPVAKELGIEHLLYTRLGVEDGILTGKVVKPTCYGEGKAAAGRSLASKYDLDLEQSYFYSDSDEDLPLFELVGRPRPLNPNRKLAQIAKERQWPVRRFTSRGTPTFGDVVRTGLLYGSLAPSVGFGVAAGLLNRSKREAVNVMGSVWGDLAASAAGIDLRVEGQEHLWSDRPAVFIFNHQSGLELVLMLKLLRRDFTGIAKQELRQNPIFGPLFSAAGVVFVDRSNTAKAIQALGPAVEALRHGRSLIIAPEGTRSTTAAVGRYLVLDARRARRSDWRDSKPLHRDPRRFTRGRVTIDAILYSRSTMHSHQRSRSVCCSAASVPCSLRLAASASMSAARFWASATS